MVGTTPWLHAATGIVRPLARRQRLGIVQVRIYVRGHRNSDAGQSRSRIDQGEAALDPLEALLSGKMAEFAVRSPQLGAAPFLTYDIQPPAGQVRSAPGGAECIQRRVVTSRQDGSMRRLPLRPTLRTMARS